MSPSARSLGLLAVLFLAGCHRAPPDDNDEPAPAPPIKLERGSKRQPNIPLEKRQAALKSLKSFSGKDLSKVDEQNELQKALITLLPDCRKEPEVLGLRPLYFWEFGKKDSYYLLFEEYAPIIHPGTSNICLTLFDNTGKVLFDQFIDTGWRCYLDSAALKPFSDPEISLIEIWTNRGGTPGVTTGKQYYALVGDRFDLVRLEDRHGAATRNRYYVGHFQCGPPIPEQSVQQWEADLLSGDSLRTLRVLAWLGGVHQKLETRDPKNEQRESVEHITLVNKLRSRPKVIARLKELANGDNKWLKEAALLALDPKDER